MNQEKKLQITRINYEHYKTLFILYHATIITISIVAINLLFNNNNFFFFLFSIVDIIAFIGYVIFQFKFNYFYKKLIQSIKSK